MHMRGTMGLGNPGSVSAPGSDYGMVQATSQFLGDTTPMLLCFGSNPIPQASRLTSTQAVVEFDAAAVMFQCRQ